MGKWARRACLIFAQAFRRAGVTVFQHCLQFSDGLVARRSLSNYPLSIAEDLHLSTSTYIRIRKGNERLLLSLEGRAARLAQHLVAQAEDTRWFRDAKSGKSAFLNSSRPGEIYCHPTVSWHYNPHKTFETSFSLVPCCMCLHPVEFPKLESLNHIDRQWV